MYNKKIAYKMLTEVVTLAQERKEKITDLNREGTNLIIDLAKNVLIKINYDLNFINESNESRMFKTHSELVSDILYLLKNSCANTTKLLKGLD